MLIPGKEKKYLGHPVSGGLYMGTWPPRLGESSDEVVKFGYSSCVTLIIDSTAKY
jgi:hypothetical protein